MNSDARERISLSRQVESTRQVQAMDDGELQDMHDAHEMEIALLSAKVQHLTDRDDAADWARRATQALNVLAVHMAWITKEQRAREVKAEKDRFAAAKAAREENSKRALELKRMADESKADRMRLANEESRRHAELFKEVVLETVGREMYMGMWQAVNQRMETMQ